MYYLILVGILYTIGYYEWMKRNEKCNKQVDKINIGSAYSFQLFIIEPNKYLWKLIFSKLLTNQLKNLFSPLDCYKTFLQNCNNLNLLTMSKCLPTHTSIRERCHQVHSMPLLKHRQSTSIL